MENTCNAKECKFLELLGGDPSNCPNYVEGWWQPLEGDPKLVKDCSPRRLILMMRNLEIRLLGVQQANEEQRNESNKVMNVFSGIVNEIERRKIEQLENNLQYIEEK